MTNIKLALKSLLLTICFFFVSAFLTNEVLATPRLYFDPNTPTVVSSQEFELNIKIDTESVSVFGVDMVINYPGSDIEVVSVSNGNFFGNTTYANNVTGRLEIHSLFLNLFEFKSGSGTAAVIKLKSNRSSGSGTITFLCSGNGSDTFILDENGTDVLSCNSLNQATITYSTTTDNGSSSSTGGSTDGEPNSCGGTCGSNYNCKSEFYCYEGFCRSPQCPSSTDCSCKSTSTPRPTRKPAGKKASPTPQNLDL